MLNKCKKKKEVVQPHGYSFEEFIIAEKCNGIREVIIDAAISDHLKAIEAGKDFRAL